MKLVTPNAQVQKSLDAEFENVSTDDMDDIDQLIEDEKNVNTQQTRKGIGVLDEYCRSKHITGGLITVLASTLAAILRGLTWRYTQKRTNGCTQRLVSSCFTLPFSGKETLQHHDQSRISGCQSSSRRVCQENETRRGNQGDHKELIAQSDLMLPNKYFLHSYEQSPIVLVKMVWFGMTRHISLRGRKHAANYVVCLGLPYIRTNPDNKSQEFVGMVTSHQLKNEQGSGCASDTVSDG